MYHDVTSLYKILVNNIIFCNNNTKFVLFYYRIKKIEKIEIRFRTDIHNIKVQYKGTNWAPGSSNLARVCRSNWPSFTASPLLHIFRVVLFHASLLLPLRNIHIILRFSLYV